MRACGLQDDETQFALVLEGGEKNLAEHLSEYQLMALERKHLLERLCLIVEHVHTRGCLAVTHTHILKRVLSSCGRKDVRSLV